MQCPETGLFLPKNHVDEKLALKKVIDEFLEKTVNQHQYLDQPYFITFHAKFNQYTGDEFEIDPPKVTSKLPPFMSNSLVWFVNNRSGLCELLWIVPPKKPGEKKLRVEFNKEGVAYLQAKGAMPSSKA